MRPLTLNQARKTLKRALHREAQARAQARRLLLGDIQQETVTVRQTLQLIRAMVLLHLRRRQTEKQRLKLNQARARRFRTLSMTHSRMLSSEKPKSELTRSSEWSKT